MPKSAAKQRFDEFINTLEGRVESGECAGPIGEYRRALEEARPLMTVQEQSELREMEPKCSPITGYQFPAMTLKNLTKPATHI